MKPLTEQILVPYYGAYAQMWSGTIIPIHVLRLMDDDTAVFAARLTRAEIWANDQVRSAR